MIRSESCSRWKYREVQSKIRGSWVFPEGRNDYEDTFAPVVRYTSIRAIMALAAKLGWKLHQMDVKTAFLNGVVDSRHMTERLMCAN